MAEITKRTVTDNARLLLGFIGGAMSVRATSPYKLVGALPEAGRMLIEHEDSGNCYEVTVKQISGTE